MKASQTCMAAVKAHQVGSCAAKVLLTPMPFPHQQYLTSVAFDLDGVPSLPILTLKTGGAKRHVAPQGTDMKNDMKNAIPWNNDRTGYHQPCNSGRWVTRMQVESSHSSLRCRGLRLDWVSNIILYPLK